MGNRTSGLHSAGTGGRAGSVFGDGMAPDVARVHARMSSAAGVRNALHSRGAREVLSADVLGGAAVRDLRATDEELPVRGEEMEGMHRGSAGMGRDPADSGDDAGSTASPGEDVHAGEGACCVGGDASNARGGSTADLLLNAPIRLPDGTVWTYQRRRIDETLELAKQKNVERLRARWRKSVEMREKEGKE